MRLYTWFGIVAALLVAGCNAGRRTTETAFDKAPSDDDGVEVIVTGPREARYVNATDRPIWVRGYKRDQPLYKLEEFDPERGWRGGGGGWCGTGVEAYEIAPGESVTFAIAPDLRYPAWRVTIHYRTAPTGGEVEHATSETQVNRPRDFIRESSAFAG